MHATFKSDASSDKVSSIGYRKLKELNLSRLVLGTVQFGIKYGVANQTGKPQIHEVMDILQQAIEGGVNCLDTAPSYGESEEVIGRCLKEMGLLDSVYVLTKVRPITDGLPQKEGEKLVVDSV